MAMYDDILYVLTSDGTNSQIWRSLGGLARTAETVVLAEWSSLSKLTTDTSAYDCDLAPSALRISSGPKLWAIDGSTSASDDLPISVSLLVSASDPLAQEAPTLLAPDDGISVSVNPANGKAYNLTFSWERYSSKYVTAMQFQIATDDAFDAVVYNQTFTGITTDTISKVIGPSGTETGTSQLVDYMPGESYYWRVRVALDSPAYSPWSEVRSFTVDELEAAVTVTVEIPAVEEEEEEAPPAVVAVPFGIVSPAAGAMDVPLQPTFVWTAVEGATSYEIMASEYDDFSILEWSHTTDQNFYPADEPFAYDTIYYWRVRAAEPEEGAWAVGIFTTEAKAVPEEPTVITVTEPAPPAEVVTVEVEKEAAIPNYLLWTIIGVGAVLVVALIVLIVRTRRVA